MNSASWRSSVIWMMRTLSPSPEALQSCFSRRRGVVSDQLVGGAEDGVRRAVVLLQLDHDRVGKVRLEFQDVAHLGAAPAVDRLVVVADHADVRALGLGAFCEQRDQIELQAVRVLKLIDHQVAEALLPAFADLRMLREQLHRQHRAGRRNRPRSAFSAPPDSGRKPHPPACAHRPAPARASRCFWLSRSDSSRPAARAFHPSRRCG